MKSNNKRRRQQQQRSTIPLAPPPTSLSRKRARRTTTLFHRLTRERDAALVGATTNSSTEVWDAQLAAMGGRREYQRASQISTSFHSTSKWVLGCLVRNGWLYGIIPTTTIHQQLPSDSPVVATLNSDEATDSCSSSSNKEDHRQENRRPNKKISRRPCRLLEVGAINTELLDAGKRSSTDKPSSVKNKNNGGQLIVRAIDLHSMHEGIEEVDFLQLPVPLERYDVVVCSMVLNCVTTAADRGAMLARFFHFLRPGGLLYLTVPKTCLNLSPFMDRARFEQMLQAVGLHVEEHTKDSPKVAFFVCRRPESAEEPPLTVDAKWKAAKVIWRGKKYRNEFAVTLCDEHVSGRSLSFDKD